MDSDEELRNIDQVLQNEVYDYSSDSDSSVLSEINRDCELIREVRKSTVSYNLSRNELDVTEIHFTEEERVIVENCSDPDLKLALIHNISLRRTLENTIKHLQSQLAADEAEIEKISTRKFKARGKKVATRIKVGIPYFKDYTKFPCPFNKDFDEIRKNKLIIMLNFHMKSWTEEDKLQLARDIYSEICDLRAKEIRAELSDIASGNNSKSNVETLEKTLQAIECKELVDKLAKEWKTNSPDYLVNDTKYEELLEQKKILQASLATGETCENSAETYKVLFEINAHIKTFPKEVLIVKTVAEWDKNLDWNKIANIKASPRHSEVECYALWNYFLNPKFTKEPWTEQEREMLKNIADKYHYCDWDAIAKELDIRRSAYMCCLHFQTNVCPKIRKEKWSREEDERLLQVIESCKTGSKISWPKVSCFFTERTRDQLYNRYRYCLHPNLKKGRFEIEEDVLLLTLARLFNNNHIRFRPYFPNRHATQIRDRIITLKSDVPRPWTRDEDEKILKHVRENGMRKWTCLPLERSCDSIRHRYNYLIKWMRDNPGGNITDVERRQCKNKLENFTERSQKVEELVKKLLKDVQLADNKNDVLNLDYIRQCLPCVTRTVEKRKQPVKRINIHNENFLSNTIKNFFQCTFKQTGPPKNTYTNEDINDCSTIIDGILKNLGANLHFPSPEEIENNPYLDEIDKLIIPNLRQSQVNTDQDYQCLAVPGSSENEVFCSRITYKFAPSPETLIGYRGVILTLPTIIKHGRGYLKNMELYEMSFDAPTIREYGLKHAIKATEEEVNELDEELRIAVMNERALFERRFRSLFWWPCLMSNFTQIPDDNKRLFCDDDSKSPRKRGRPKKDLSKIQKMNKAKKLKNDSIKMEPECSDYDPDDLMTLSD